MKALVTYTRAASEKAKLALKALDEENVKRGYLFHINVYSVPEITEDTDKFVNEAISKLDASMKGWKPVADGKETHYQIHHTADAPFQIRQLPELEYAYTRYYTK